MPKNYKSCRPKHKDRCVSWTINFQPRINLWVGNMYWEAEEGLKNLPRKIIRASSKEELLELMSPWIEHKVKSSCRCPDCKTEFEAEIEVIGHPKVGDVYLLFCDDCRPELYKLIDKVAADV